MIEVDIKKVMEHYEVYDKQGNFQFSADNMREVAEELQNLEQEVQNGH